MSKQRSRRRYRRRKHMLRRVAEFQRKWGFTSVKIVQWGGFKGQLIVQIEGEEIH